MPLDNSPSAFAVLRMLHAVEFSGQHDYGSSFADSMSVIWASQKALRQSEAVAAFHAAQACSERPEQQVIFAAVIAGMANPAKPANVEFAHELRPVFLAACTSLHDALGLMDPYRAFELVTANQDQFTGAAEVATMASAALQRSEPHLTSRGDRQLAREIAGLIRNNVKASLR